MHDADAPDPAMSNAVNITPITAEKLDSIAPIVAAETIGTVTATDMVTATDIINSVDAAALRKQLNILATEFLVFDAGYSAKVRNWCKANPDSHYRAVLAGIVRNASIRMQNLAQEIEGSDSDKQRCNKRRP